MANDFNGQKVADLWTWNKNGRRGLNGRGSSRLPVILPADAQFLIVPIADDKRRDNGPTHTLFVMLDNEDAPISAPKGDDDIPFE